MVKLEKSVSEYVRIHCRMYEHLPLEDDDFSIILKGHLLLEELLRENIARKFIDSSSLNDAKISFSQCIYICKGLYKGSVPDWVWEAIHKLNKIRNKLAHNLEAKGLDEQIADLINFCHKNGTGYVDSANDLVYTELAMAITEIHYELWKLFKSHLTRR